MIKTFIFVYLLLNIRNVVTNRCTSPGPPAIPQNVTQACEDIGDGLILKYSCRHDAGVFNNSNDRTCCR